MLWLEVLHIDLMPCGISPYHLAYAQESVLHEDEHPQACRQLAGLGSISRQRLCRYGEVAARRAGRQGRLHTRRAPPLGRQADVDARRITRAA
jgi:hypothetical protein